jgi:hypothetical protein
MPKTTIDALQTLLAGPEDNHEVEFRPRGDWGTRGEIEALP